MTTIDVSVIIPHYNALSTIENSVRSVLSQTVAVKEIIVVDDCSGDFSALLSILASFGQIVPVRAVRLDINSGASEARNKGVELAVGRYLAFLDADDVWHHDKVEIQYALMEQYKLKISGHLYIQDLNIRPMFSLTPFRTRSISAMRFVFGNPFFTPTVMVRRDGFIPFDSRYRRVDDYKCWFMNIRKKNNAFIMLPLAGGFKSAIGVSGLTASLQVMHESYLLVLKDLYREGHVSPLFFGLALFFEYVKYPMRIVKKSITTCHTNFKLQLNIIVKKK
ncbi:MAG: glycosyltransferase family 2 protein [Methylotenera sp.]|nr:glycosyltransferase family 2 protein [Methylotenera sp.]